MNEQINDGGPAMPTNAHEDHWGTPHSATSGLSLRDYFAARAMYAAIAAKNDEVMRGYEGWRDEFAREAYRYADAMLAARSKS
jgi:hypothetical protein